MESVAVTSMKNGLRLIRGPLAREGLFRFSGHQLLLSLVAFMVAWPFFEGIESGEVVMRVGLTFVLVSALAATGGRRRVFAVATLLILPAVAIGLRSQYTHHRDASPWPALSAAVAVAFTELQLVRFIFRAARVNAEVLCSAISVYLLSGLLWSLLYLLTDRVIPNSFATPGVPGSAELNFPNALYFSFAALTTAGFGDIVPVSHHARSLATLESVFGVLYLAVLISRMVSMYSRSPAADPAGPL